MNENQIKTLEGIVDFLKETDLKMDVEVIMKPIKDEYEPKKGDFVVVNENTILQMREGLDDLGLIGVEGVGLVEVKSIREAHASEREGKIEEFKSRGYVCTDGLWVEPKLEDVYCVAKSKADFIRAYSVKPELVDEANATLSCEWPIIKLGMDGLWNGDEVNNLEEVSIEQFINLIKKA